MWGRGVSLFAGTPRYLSEFQQPPAHRAHAARPRALSSPLGPPSPCVRLVTSPISLSFPPPAQPGNPSPQAPSCEPRGSPAAEAGAVAKGSDEREQRRLTWIRVVRRQQRRRGYGPEAHQGRAREAPREVVSIHLQGGRGQGEGAPRCGEAAGVAWQGWEGVRWW
jgi:hypothetical protein